MSTSTGSQATTRRSIAARQAAEHGAREAAARASRSVRYVTSLMLVCAAFWAYWLFVVPLIEPAVQPVVPLAPHLPVMDLNGIELAKHFPADAWQHEAKRLEMKYGALMFGDDVHESKDGVDRIVLRPVTLIFVADESNDSLGARPIILDAPEGIEVITGAREQGESKSPLSIGAPVAGRLLGKVRIRRAASPGKNDGFQLFTRNVQIDEKRIATPYEVRFDMGANYGVGSDLEILLHNPDDVSEEEPSEFAMQGKPFPIKSMELVKLDKLVVYVDEQQTLNETDSASAVPTAGVSPGTPVEVTCDGPLNVDLTRGVATLEEDVRIARIVKEGPPDMLTCDLVEVHFGMAESTAKATTEPAASSEVSRLPLAADAAQAEATDAESSQDSAPSAKLQIKKVIASGYPVRLVSAAQAAEARGEQLVFDPDTSVLSLLGANGVVMTHDGHLVSAVRLDYQFDKQEPGRLGKLWAQGPGELSGMLGENQQFVARWNKLLKLAPKQHQHVISIFEGVHFAAGAAGQFDAEQLHFYLNEVVRPPGGDRAKPKREFLPDRLQASGNVRVNSPQMSVRTNEIQAWFHPQVGQPLPSNQPTGGLALGDPKRASGPRVDATGRIVQLKLRYDDKLRVSLDELQVRGDVEVRRAPSVSRTGKPKEGFKLRGDVLSISGIEEEQLNLQVAGRPARLEMGSGHVESGSVVLRQAENQLQAMGAGNLSMPQKIKQDDGTFVAGPPIRVAWKEQLKFDGGRLSLLGGVSVVGQRPLKAGETMVFQGSADTLEAVLSRGYSFAQLDQLSQQKLEIAEVVLRGRVEFAGATNTMGQQTSLERMQVGEIQFNPQTHAVLALGPGWLSSIRTKIRGGDDRKRQGTALPQTNVPRQTAGDAVEEAPTLHYMRIEFEDELRGNAKQRDMQFANRVRCVYGQVETWDEVVQDGTNRGGRGAELTCRTLRIAEVPRDRERAMLLDAAGNIYIQSEQFDAHAARLTYDQLKDLMVLHGDPRGGATLRYSPMPGGAAIPMTAQRIKFWPKSMKVDVEGFNSITAPLGFGR